MSTQLYKACLCTAILTISGCGTDTEKKSFVDLYQQAEMLDSIPRDYDSVEPIRPVPALEDLEYSAPLVQLGNQLFHDPQLSGDGSRSCSSCHDTSNGGDDGRRFSVGINNQIGSINSPTVLNATFNFQQFWDGRARDLESQALEPLTNPKEMGSHLSDLVLRLTSADEYDQTFREAFGDNDITVERIIKALASFESMLITPSPFDRYLQGEADAISTNAKHGYKLFKEFGCASCHQGINVGGNLFHKFGALHSIYDIETKTDKGRENITNNPEDRAVFKVPSLRNVALTAPYFHRGEVEELELAIRVMGLVQLNKDISDTDIEFIAEFLRSLTGEFNLANQIVAAEAETE